MDNKFIIVVTVYNSVNYIEKCIESILAQDYKNYELCVIDDCSTDGTWQKIDSLNNKYGGVFNECKNEYRRGSVLVNLIKAIELFSFDKEDIIVIVDGDDSLIGTDVLTHLNGVYQDPMVYMTYGQFVPISGEYGAFCKEIPDTRTYRKSGKWLASHLKTFKRKLWDKIDDKDLRDTQGKYFSVSWDASVLYCMIEMCGHKHMRFINKVMYLYNDQNPLCDMYVNTKISLSVSAEARTRTPYEEIDTL